MLRPLLATLALAAPLVAAAPAGAIATRHNTLVSFHSPSGNIGCLADDTDGKWQLRCDVRERSWTGARPRDCDLDSGDALGMSASGRPYWVCHGDTVLGQGRVLAYGSTWGAGPFTCTSAAAGVTCRNRGGHGFFLSRASYQIF